MARVVTLANLRTWARQLSDTENDPNVGDAELTALANRHLTEVYDTLVDAGPADYYAATESITTAAGVTTYALPADFRSLLDVYARESATEVRNIPPVGAGERGKYRSPSGVWTLDVEYIPVAPTLVDDGDTFDGVSGWEELIANLMARDTMIKRESDPSAVMANISRLEGRIASRSRQRDKGHPKRIVDTDEQAARTWPWGYQNNVRVCAYRLRGANIEFYESVWGLP